MLGIEGYRQIIEQMRENKISLPMVAIGGLTPDDIDPLAELGIGVAMSGTILNAENPVTMTRQIHDKCFGLFIENLNHFFENHGTNLGDIFSVSTIQTPFCDVASDTENFTGDPLYFIISA